MNEELIVNAVSFLKDPAVSNSPLNKKIEFLTSKGLNETEIEEAIRRANVAHVANSLPSSETPGNPNSPPSVFSQSPPPPIDYYSPPPLPERDWKDYFVMATATVGVGFGIYQVFTRYVLPKVLPPTKTDIENDKEIINDEFIKIDALLQKLTEEQDEMKAKNGEKLKELDVTLSNLNDCVTVVRDNKMKLDDDLKLMKLEIENLKSSIVKTMDKQKAIIADELSQVTKELESLKSLISTRKESKLPKVSSIPSASEILRNSGIKTDTVKNDTKQEEPKTAAPAPTAQIPAWQQQAQPKEENKIPSWQQSTTPIPSTTNNETKPEKSAIPSWQNAGAVSDTLDKVETKTEIPSWQLRS